MGTKCSIFRTSIMSPADIANYYLFAKTVRAGKINEASRELELPKSTIQPTADTARGGAGRTAG